MPRGHPEDAPPLGRLIPRVRRFGTISPSMSGGTSETTSHHGSMRSGGASIQHTAATRFRTGSLADGFALVKAIGGVVEAGDRPPHLDLRPDGVTVRLVADDRSELTEGDLTLATEMTASGTRPGTSRPTRRTSRTCRSPSMRSSWPTCCPSGQAVLGYDFVELLGDTLVDPKHYGPDGVVPADGRAPSAAEPGQSTSTCRSEVGRKVASLRRSSGRPHRTTSGHAPMWWTLADPEGNEVDAAPWRILDEMTRAGSVGRAAPLGSGHATTGLQRT